MFKALFLCLPLMLLSFLTNANDSAVILQYHNVSDNTPPSTSISPEGFKEHLEWIVEHEFDVLPLPTIIEQLKANKPLTSSKTLAITFDDASHSVCDTAWPILKEYKLAFTLFISTEGVEKGFQSSCSWGQLKEMHASGLMTLANHTHQHLNMVSNELLKNDQWSALVKDEIIKAQNLIESNLGPASKLFAYPYGEYNSTLAAMVTELGYIGVGQHSGAISADSDFSALPRFPASGKFADLDTLSVKMYSLAYPATLSSNTENPIDLNSAENPPTLRIKPAYKDLLKTTNCFNSQGEKLSTKIENSALLVSAKDALGTGRHRYTCTSKSKFEDRFYWISHQWLIEGENPSWFNRVYRKWFGN